MGCPDKAVQRQGAGAKLITNPDLAIEIISAAKKSTKLPVSIKTRIGYNKIDLDWIKLLLMQDLPALTVHLRTKKEMSLVPAHWDIMSEIVKLRDQISPHTLIVGNGDVNSLSQARELCAKHGCDGIMIGRGAFGQPWFFAENKKLPELKERLKILLEHAKLFDKTFLGIKNFDVMKKHFKAYIHGFDGAKELRNRLMETKSFKEMKKILSE
jgi:tRNA-dihydrouridine synthase